MTVQPRLRSIPRRLYRGRSQRPRLERYALAAKRTIPATHDHARSTGSAHEHLPEGRGHEAL